MGHAGKCVLDVAGGEQAEVSYLGVSFGQGVQEESSDELYRMDRSGFVVFGEEGDFVMMHCEQSLVGNGHAMGIPSEVFENGFRSTERKLGVYDPLFPV